MVIPLILKIYLATVALWFGALVSVIHVLGDECHPIVEKMKDDDSTIEECALSYVLVFIISLVPILRLAILLSILDF